MVHGGRAASTAGGGAPMPTARERNQAMTLIYLIAGISIVPLFVLGLFAHVRVRRVFARRLQEPTKKGLTGSRLARTMLNASGLNDVLIEEVEPNLADHYDPSRKVVRLSRNVARSSSVAAIGIAAHEAAHAIQDGSNFTAVRIRNGMAPIVQKAAFFILPLLFLGILMGSVIATSLFVNIAVILFLGIVVFYLVTLPLELKASSMALRYIKDNGIADEKEITGVEEVLRAAVLTYIIAAALAVAQFFRLLGLYRILKV